MAICSSILAWKISWTEEPGKLQSMGHKELSTTEHTHTFKCYVYNNNFKNIAQLSYEKLQLDALQASQTPISKFKIENVYFLPLSLPTSIA